MTAYSFRNICLIWTVIINLTGYLSSQYISERAQPGVKEESRGKDDIVIKERSLNKTELKEDLFDFPELTNKNKYKKLKLWATHYKIHSAQAINNGFPLLTFSGEALGPRLSEQDWCRGAVEGTIFVKGRNKDGGVYNFFKTGKRMQVDCSPYFSSLSSKVIRNTGKSRFKIARGPYGDGVAGMILRPYRTIAVDSDFIPYGSVIYIPDARGIKITLPSMMTVEHDGYFFAADRGGAIKKNHIDIFMGHDTENPFSRFAKSHKKARVVLSMNTGRRRSGIITGRKVTKSLKSMR